MRTLAFPAFPAKGYEGCISSEIISEETQAAKEKFGIVGLVGDIHSHPRGFVDRLIQNLPSPNKHSLHAHFSIADLYIMADTEIFRPMMVLVEGDYNLAVFRTKQTVGLVADSTVFSQESFQRYWYENNGYKFIGSDTLGEHATPVSSSANINKITAKILKRHSLVIYQGYKNMSLRKVIFI